MTNEELALKIQNGERNLIPTLWEQVERFIYLKSENWYWQHEETCIRCGVALDDLKHMVNDTLIAKCIRRKECSFQKRYQTNL